VTQDQIRKTIRDQQTWIEQCEQNPKSSYYGDNALAVRKADRDALSRLQERVKYRRR